MTDQELKDLVASLAIGQAKLDKEMANLAVSQTLSGAKLDAAMANLAVAESSAKAQAEDTSRFMKELGRRMGAMASNQGDVAEEFFFNSLDAKPQIGNITFDSVTPNLTISRKGKSNEFDIVLTNGQSVALIEVKYKAHLSDLDQVQAQVQRYRDWRPEHKDYKIYSGLAGFSVPAEVVKAAHERGLFVLKRMGDVVEVDAGAMRAF